MEGSVEEIVETFEMVDKNECNSECVSPVRSSTSSHIEDDDKSNNNQTSENFTEESMQSAHDDNNNKSNNSNKIKKFSREELIKFKQSMLLDNSAIKENVLSSIYQEDNTLLDRTLDRQKSRTAGGNRGGDAIEKMMPAYTQRNSYQKQRSIDHQSNRRSQQGNRANSSQNLIQKRLTTNEEIRLNTAENAWKPTALIKPAETSESEAKTDELLKQFRSILNKLTPENSSTLIQNLKQLTIDTVDRLDGCISLVFEKAINEPNFSASYAQLCKEVSNVFVVPLDEKNSQQKAVFKNRLITQCQNEFMKLRNSESLAERLKQIEEEQDESKKEELKAEYEDENLKMRRRAVGTVHFIGELYKIEMLTSKIMMSCISHLLDPSMCNEETLECLCKLLTTIGKRLEKLDAKKVDLSVCFSTLSKIADKKHPLGISSRIRFMIQDLIELRLNNWTPRKLQRENKPLTMDEIKRQVEMEQYTNKMDIRENDNRSRAGFGLNSNKSQRSGMATEDGWSTASYTKKPINFDVKKLTNLPQVTDDIVLGGQGVPSFHNFSTNRFSGLREDESMPEVSSNSSQNNRSYQGRFSGGGQNMNNNQNRNSFDRNNRRNNSNNGNNQNRSAGSRSLQPMNMGQNESSSQKQAFSPNRKISQQPQTRPDLPIKSYSMQTRKISAPARTMAEWKGDDLIEDLSQVGAAIKKLVNSFQCGEVTLDEMTQKLNRYRFKKEILVNVYNWSFDQNDRERFHLSEILTHCVTNGIFPVEVMKMALQELMESASELACDLPHVFRYIGEILVTPISKRVIQVCDLLEISNIEIERDNGATVLKNLLTVVDQKHGRKTVQQLYNENKVDFEKFLHKDTNLTDFFMDNKFEYLVNQLDADTDSTTSMLLDEATISEIQKTLMSPSRDVDSLIIWIQNHVKHTTDVGFIRALTVAVLEICLEKITEGYQVNKSKLENASALLTQFTDGKMDREIYCLYAVNGKLVELEHPVGCTNEILTCMYDHFVFSKETFMKWKDDNNPKEQEGKGVTLKSCTAFIQFLRDTSDSTGDES